MILLVAHDAGGAEVLSSYARRQNLACTYSVAGPAVSVFERKLGPIGIVPLEEGIVTCDWLLCGTGWQSDLEWSAIGLAERFRKRSVAFLDHWVNYADRFVRNGVQHLPREVWVGDTTAQELAQATLPDIPVRLVQNPYFLDIEEELARLPRRFPGEHGAVSVLYVCEPTSEHSSIGHTKDYWGYTEQDALRYFLSNVWALGPKISRVVIRPHPSEPKGKYYWAAEEFDLPLDFSSGRSLVVEVGDCDIVVGCESVAMVVGLLARKRVVSAIPPGGTPCQLPHSEIEHLQQLTLRRQ